jgi:uncharacterized glyoxalase superfamily protein PhnB
LADGDPSEAAPNPQYLYFSADDLDEAYRGAREAGCRDLGEIEVQPWGERSFSTQAGDKVRRPELRCLSLPRLG